MNEFTDSELAAYAKTLDDDCLKYGIIDLKNQIKNNDRVERSKIELKAFIAEKKARK